jgi:hypothetical protein
MKSPARKPAEHAIRALTLFTDLLVGHLTFRVSDDGSAPHLKENEFAVVDTTDREV